MKKNSKTLTAMLLIASIYLMASCKKDEAPKKDLATSKKEWLTGTWKQKDIQLAVTTSVKVGGTKIKLKEGMSMLDDPTINYLLTRGGASPNPFLYTRDNVYNFNSDGSYKVDGIVDFGSGTHVLVGGSGTWDTEVYSSVLALFPSKEKRDPHWINNITASRLNLAISVFLGKDLGDVPMKLLLEKQ